MSEISGDICLTRRQVCIRSEFYLKWALVCGGSQARPNQNGVTAAPRHHSHRICISMQLSLRGKTEMVSGRDMHDSTLSKGIIFREHGKVTLLRNIISAACKMH